jgi:peptide deformylase
MSEALVERAAEAFAAALLRWRTERGLSKKQLAAAMGFDPSYVSHVEARRHRPTEDFARRAENALRAGGAIVARFRDYEAARQGSVARPRHSDMTELRLVTSAGLVVELEDAQLSYVDGEYRCLIRRDLYNAGRDPVTRYPVRIAVDRYPGEPERSNRHYHEHPLTWSELHLDARRGDDTMSWQAKQDRDAFKEVWLLFENEDSKFPLYPGEGTTIEYGYTVGEDKWGHWFQRAIRLPTRKLTVSLDFPQAMRPVVWGVESSLTAEAGALPSPVIQRARGDRVHFVWSTETPALNARYRLEWRFRVESPPVSRNGNGHARYGRPSELMRSAGILQRGAPMLESTARWFDLPAQADVAEGVVGQLLDALQRVERLHEFSKGMGLAATQIGINWAVAAVRDPDSTDAQPVVLLNPRVVAESIDRDEQHEGCLSFFDVRGLVSRPRLIEVEHERLDGERVVSTFRDAMARLVAHEVDHLGGLLYSDRMPPDARLIPVEEYADQGQPWQYGYGATPTAS